MAEKIYTKNGFIIKGKKYVIMFNNEPFMGYDWYTDDHLNWIGIKKDKHNMSVTYKKNINLVWRKIIPLL